MISHPIIYTLNSQRPTVIVISPFHPLNGRERKQREEFPKIKERKENDRILQSDVCVTNFTYIISYVFLMKEENVHIPFRSVIHEFMVSIPQFVVFSHVTFLCALFTSIMFLSILLFSP